MATILNNIFTSVCTDEDCVIVQPINVFYGILSAGSNVLHTIKKMKADKAPSDKITPKTLKEVTH